VRPRPEPFPPIYPLPPHVCTRLQDFGAPQHVYIVGAGKMGSRYYDQIPPRAFTIAVNRMIAYPREWCLWMAFDKNTIHYPYWTHPIPDGTRVVLGTFLARRHPRANYFFNSGGGDRRQNLVTPHGLRGGGTISGCALQLAALMGAEHITLVGVDMCGKFHYDNTPAAQRGGMWEGRMTWMMRFIRYAQGCGIEVDTLSPSALCHFGLRRVRC